MPASKRSLLVRVTTRRWLRSSVCGRETAALKATVERLTAAQASATDLKAANERLKAQNDSQATEIVQLAT